MGSTSSVEPEEQWGGLMERQHSRSETFPRCSMHREAIRQLLDPKVSRLFGKRLFLPDHHDVFLSSSSGNTFWARTDVWIYAVHCTDPFVKDLSGTTPEEKPAITFRCRAGLYLAIYENLAIHKLDLHRWW